MSGTTTPTTPVAYIDFLGIHVPSFQDVLTYLQTAYQAIYGSDVYLGNDSQDGQLLGVFALAISDANAMAAAVYASFSPATAQGAGLSSVVKINGISRAIATNSTVDFTIIGQTGTQIINGIVRDPNNNNWLLPPSVLIPLSGTIVATAVSATPGDITLTTMGVDTANNIGTILTPVRGWQSVSNVAAAVPGDPLETDALLRQRQTVSTALPSHTIMDGIVGALSQISGVTRLAAYENDTGVADPNGLPAHSISLVVDGGDANAIAFAIMTKKTPGASTYGTTSESVTDSSGVTDTISFFRPTEVAISVALTIDPLAGYTTATAGQIATAIANYIQGLAIGMDVFLSKLYGPANLDTNPALSNTFNVVSPITISRSGPPVAQDVVIAFNEAATCSVNNVTVTVIVNP